MKRKSWKLILAFGLCAASTHPAAFAASLGVVVPIGGHASDLALDERRGALYIANFTANRVDVMSLSDFSIQTSMNVAAQPGSLAISPDGRHLVVAHFGNFEGQSNRNNALTVIDLETRGRQTFALASPPLGVAFGINGLALVATTTDFTLFDPWSGVSRLIVTFEELAATSLPVAPATFPPNIVAASMNVSGDGNRIYGLTDTFEFGYDATSGRLSILRYVSEPPQGPRAVSVNGDGSRYLSGWVLHGTAIWDWAAGVWNLAQFPEAEGLLNVGSHAIDSSRGLIYAQFTQKPDQNQSQNSQQNAEPVLQVLDGENLAVRERIRLPENLAGKSLLSSNHAVMYSISDSGVMVIPVGSLDQVPRLKASVEDLHFQGTFCNRRLLTKEFTLADPSGRRTDFSLNSDTAGVDITPSSGTTPATIVVRVDPTAFQNAKGTAVAKIAIASGGAVNKPGSLRVLVNNPEPDQRGASINVPGALVDILADPFRDRFFVLRQDTNEVLVFDAQTYRQVGSLRTGNTPTQMAITFDRRYLLVGHDNSQYIAVFDIETLQPSLPHIRMPGGHYPRSIAASGKAILAANRVAGPVHTIDRVDMATRMATELPSLGVYKNEIDINTVLIASPNGSSILAAEKDGNVLLYSAIADTFTISRKDAAREGLKGAYAASSYDQFVVGNRLMNASLVTTNFLEAGTGEASGFVFVDAAGFRTTAPSSNAAGVVQRVDTQSGLGIRATRMTEAPLLGSEAFPFTRTLATLYNRQRIVSLTTSGFTVLPWDYDASVAPPKISGIVNAADYTAPVAPGGLVTIFGEQLSPTNEATNQIPLPTALGGSCLTVNGVSMPVLFVSPTQVNAQLPFNVEGHVTLVLRTPGGVSDNYNLAIAPTAPSVFRSGAAGSLTGLPTVVRYGNGQLVTPSNPIHPEDTLVIYLTGMGRTYPPVEAGEPAPSQPLATALTPTEVTLGGVGLPITYAGLAPGMVGVYQINAKAPWWVSPGMQQPLTIVQGGGSTTLSVRVVK
ncbi:MAG: hypothetical protein KIT09_14935 [Bryobacteraceae bacterium]|nr:hypothetical protein [Bryobacteraceae bacterium]